MAIDGSRVAAALRDLANAFDGASQTGDGAAAATSGATPAATPRGRGRPAKGEGTPPPVQTTAAPADDPFATPAAPAVPTATIEEVRKALTDLKNAVSQDYALKILKDSSGVDNLAALSQDKYGAVVAAVKAVMTQKQSEPDDPFALPTEQAAPPAKPLTIEEVKAVIVETQKRTSQDAVQKIVMENGGKAKNPDTGAEGPSLKALPADKYAATVAALKALPSTK